MLGDAERPAENGAIGPRVQVRQFTDGGGGDARDQLATRKRPLHYALSILLETRRPVLDEGVIGETAHDDLASDGV